METASSTTWGALELVSFGRAALVVLLLAFTAVAPSVWLDPTMVPFLLAAVVPFAWPSPVATATTLRPSVGPTLARELNFEVEPESFELPSAVALLETAVAVELANLVALTK